jgi:hypothetical protein
VHGSCATLQDEPVSSNVASAESHEREKRIAGHPEKISEERRPFRHESGRTKHYFTRWLIRLRRQFVQIWKSAAK